MKRILSLLVIAIIAISSAIAATVVVDGHHVRLRVGPGLNYAIVTNSHGTPVYPPKGAHLTYYGTSGNFYYVGYNGYSAYISRDYCHLQNAGGAGYNGGYSGYSNASVVIVDGVHVRLRVGPGLNYAIVTNSHGTPVYPPKGTRLTYLGTSGGFFHVRYNGYDCYISRDYSHLR